VGPTFSCWPRRPGTDGYDSRPTLDDGQWATLLGNLDRLGAAAAEKGVLAVLHPHVGTMVENRSDVDRVLAGSQIKLCLDTGHLLIGEPIHCSWPARCPAALPTPISRTSTPPLRPAFERVN
jgi:sugar phosphate isomerase/epimerase